MTLININMTLLCCNGAVTTWKKKFTIDYEHWFAIWNFGTTKIKILNVSLNKNILRKLLQKFLSSSVSWKKNNTSLRMKNWIDNPKNLIVLKMTQFSILMTSLWLPYDVIIQLLLGIHLIYIIIKSKKFENIQNIPIFAQVWGVPQNHNNYLKKR